jgi:two-component system response regulator
MARSSGEFMKREIKIMLVEDSIEDATFTEHVLKFNKLQKDLVLAGNGQDALQALEKCDRDGSHPNLILLDINLPDISGIDLLKQIKKDARFSKIPVVILTGSNEDEDIQKSYDLGAGSYLVKPISNSALMQVIERLF